MSVLCPIMCVYFKYRKLNKTLTKFKIYMDIFKHPMGRIISHLYIAFSLERLLIGAHLISS